MTAAFNLLTARRRHFHLDALILAGLVVAIALCGLPPVRAADSPAPLILIVNGDLWTWTAPDKPLKQLTTWGYNSDPVISPDGKSVAYLSEAAVRVDEYRKGNTAFEGYGPLNIWVLDLATGTGTRLADQPPDARAVDKYVERSRPAWSPDGKALAWTDLPAGQPAPNGSKRRWERLTVYDLAKKTERTLVPDLPRGTIDALRNPTPLAWGTAGLLFLITPEPDAVYVYGPDGKPLTKISLTATDCTSCDTTAWLKDGDKDLILVHPNRYRPSEYLLFDPATGKKVKSTGHLERYSLSAPNGLALFSKGESWFVSAPGQPDFELGELGTLTWAESLTISPDGKQVAFLREKKVFVFRAGQVEEIPLGEGKFVSGLAWSAMGWRLARP